MHADDIPGISNTVGAGRVAVQGTFEKRTIPRECGLSDEHEGKPPFFATGQGRNPAVMKPFEADQNQGMEDR
jgi:hypothetical protein